MLSIQLLGAFRVPGMVDTKADGTPGPRAHPRKPCRLVGEMDGAVHYAPTEVRRSLG